MILGCVFCVLVLLFWGVSWVAAPVLSMDMMLACLMCVCVHNDCVSLTTGRSCRCCCCCCSDIR